MSSRFDESLERLTPTEALQVVRQAFTRDRATETLAELRVAIEALVKATLKSYTQEAARYASLRGEKLSPRDRRYLRILLNEVRRRVASGEVCSRDGKWNMLDVGAGPGRDLAFLASETGDVYATGVEKCEEFLRVLRAAKEQGLIHSAPYELDMRRLTGVPDDSYACVRHHATLHHLPLLWEGLGVDEAISESFRVLQPGGVLYALVKQGTGLQLTDTNDGMGQRLVQLFTRETINTLLGRNGFRVVRMESHWEWERDMDWLLVIAERPGTVGPAVGVL